MSFLLDTNIVSEWTKPAPDPKVDDWLKSLGPDELYLSVVSLAEIRYGVEKLEPGRRRSSLEAWLAEDLPAYFADQTLPIDEHVALAWAQIYRRCERAGTPMSIMDAFLAATAEVHALTLVTRNAKDFKAWGGPIFNPWTERTP